MYVPFTLVSQFFLSMICAIKNTDLIYSFALLFYPSLIFKGKARAVRGAPLGQFSNNLLKRK